MKQKTASRLVAILALAALLGLAGCGVPSQGGTGNNNGSGTPTGNGTTPTPSPKPGQVNILLDKTHYGVNDTITVSITNGLATSIYSAQRYTNCTILTLQWKSGASWAVWGRCLAEQTPHLTQVKAQSITPIQLIPGNTGAGVPRKGTTLAWQPGTYRIVFSYNTIPDEENPQGVVAQSATFTIG
jgi:hypothetical protein